MAINAGQLNIGLDLYTPFWLFAAGVQATSGLLYFPEISGSENGHVLVVNPALNTASVIQMGTIGMGDWQLGHGHRIPDGRIVYLMGGSYNQNELRVYVINPATNVVSLVSTGVSSAGSSSVLHSNGKLYNFRGVSLGSRVSIIDTTTLAGTAVSVVYRNNAVWYPAGASEGSDGKIYAATGYYRNAAGDPPILIFDPVGNTFTFTTMGLPTLAQTQFYADGITMPDGRIYYIPGLYFATDPQPMPLMVIDPAAGTAVLRTPVPTIGWRFGQTGYQRAVAGADGRIYWTGQGPADPAIGCLVAYDPVTDSYETHPYRTDHDFIPSYALAATATGSRIFGAPTEADSGDYDASDLLLRVDAIPAAPPAMCTPRWAPQTVEEFPRVLSPAVVAGTPYLSGGLYGSGELSVLQINPDNTVIEYPSTTVGNWPVTVRSVAAAGSKFLMTEQNNGGTLATVQVFDTVTKATARYSVNTSINTPRWSGGALGPDGKVYFPPVRSSGAFTAILPLVFNPATNAITFSNFGSTWKPSAYSGAVMGGDGRMYFLPGYFTAAGGTTFPGAWVMVLNFATMTMSQVNLPHTGDSGDPYTCWGMPAADGVYVMFRSYRLYRLNASGWTLLRVTDPDDNAYVDYGDLSGTFTPSDSAAVGDDGRIHCIGTVYIANGNYPPAVLTLDPADDSVRFTEFLGMGTSWFTPTLTYPIAGGVSAFTYYFTGGAAFPDRFAADICSAVAPPTHSYAVGAIPVSLALGDVPLELALG